MAFTIGELGIYPDTINEMFDRAISLLEEADFSQNEINKAVDSVGEAFRSGHLDTSDITNSLIGEMFSTVKEMVETKYRKADISYYVNCDDSHLYVNGQEYRRPSPEENSAFYDFLHENCFEFNFADTEVTDEGLGKAIFCLKLQDDTVYWDILSNAVNQNGKSAYDAIVEHLSGTEGIPQHTLNDATGVFRALDRLNLHPDMDFVAVENGQFTFTVAGHKQRNFLCDGKYSCSLDALDGESIDKIFAAFDKLLGEGEFQPEETDIDEEIYDKVTDAIFNMMSEPPFPSLLQNTAQGKEIE